MPTLPYLKVLLNNSANLDPSKNMKACEDFFLTVLHAHVLAAADHLMEMCSLTARRSPRRLLSDFKL